MRKLKYQGGVTKLITSEIGKKNRQRFENFVKRNLYSFEVGLNRETIEMEVVSFSSSNDFYEQVLSILSFLQHVGTPASWTIYSDGSHTAVQMQLLTAAFNFIKFKIKNCIDDNQYLVHNCKEKLLPFKDCFSHYAMFHPLGKKLFLYLNHKIKKPTLFIDSDILFYNQASVLNAIVKEKVGGWYLPDADWGCLDSRYKKNNTKQLYQINAGFFILNYELTDLEEGLNFLKSLEFKYEYFSEQNIFHILFRSNNFMPLDPRIFILNSGDQFDFSYLRNREEMAIRHYTGPVRHKMWQRDWKWHLSLSK